MKVQSSLEEFVRKVYGDCRRKGLAKAEVEHPWDVARFAHLDEIEEPFRRSSLYRVCLLHDVIEDHQEYTLSNLASRFHLSERERHILCLLDRKDRDNTAYWRGIFSNTDAVRVKLADRVANLRDLIAWMKAGGAQCPRCLEQARRYLEANSIISALCDEMQPHPGTGGDVIGRLRAEVDELCARLGKIMPGDHDRR